MPNISFQASWHFLHKLSPVWSCCFYSDHMGHMKMWRKDFFCYSNYNHKSQKLFPEGILKHNGFCGRLGPGSPPPPRPTPPPTLIRPLWALCRAEEQSRGRGTSVLWVSYSPDLNFWLKEWRAKKSDQSTPLQMQSLAFFPPFFPLPCFSMTSYVADANPPQSYPYVLNKYSRQLPIWLLRSCPGFASRDTYTVNSAPKISSSKINFPGYWELDDLSVSLGSFNNKKELKCLLSYLLIIDGSSVFTPFFNNSFYR